MGLVPTTLFVITIFVRLFCVVFFFVDSADSKCTKSFECGALGTLEFPLSTRDRPECGLFFIDGCNTSGNKIKVNTEWSYDVRRNVSKNGFQVYSTDFANMINSDSCFAFQNLSIPKSPSISFSITPNLTLFACLNVSHNSKTPPEFEHYNRHLCPDFTVYYENPPVPYDSRETNLTGKNCSMIQLPYKPSTKESSDIFDMLSAEFDLEWTVSDECNKCHHGGGQCLTNSINHFICKKGKSRLALILAIAISGGVTLAILCLFGSYIIWQRKKKMSSKGYYLSRNVSLDPSLKTDHEVGSSFFFGIPIFLYAELEEATNRFDPLKELGDGGYGTVYHGKLRDGREVAIKRLYEHNYKRLEQFMNEIKILTCLRHPNLVSLYGCTSRRSRDLLLVYEYVPNGTVADHLHGERAKDAPLTWDVRMSIAIETASALAYLHRSDIVHRDVKTSNILLDNNFNVKVADFGISRLFPNDVTHISTAPQGTPGYVDPEYHQCYQLTGKSDVYSFGVVLIELISSMPAVDITRHRHEINLANLALNRIQKCAFDELIDPLLGYTTDDEVRRMTTCVAELAFRCLQLEKDLRPSMDEVLETLLSIQRGEGFKFEKAKNEKENNGVDYWKTNTTSPETDDVVLLKKREFLKSSPSAITDAWASSGSTTTSSVG